MIRRAILAACIAFPIMAQTTTIQPSGSAPATETRTFALQSGGRLKISNISGNVSVSAWDKDEAALTANFKPNSNGEHRLIDVESDKYLLELIVKNQESKLKLSKQERKKLPRVVEIGSCDIELKVPRHILSNINIVNGKVTLNAITGKSITNVVNGNIVFENINGDINGSVVNGHITGSIHNIDVDLNLSTVNGDIKVELLNPNGHLRASTIVGSVKIPSGVKNVTKDEKDIDSLVISSGVQHLTEKNVAAKFDGNAYMKFRSVRGSITISIPGFDN